jgi:hypothetical protein
MSDSRATLAIDPAAFGAYLRAMFGPAPLPELNEEELRWETDGGPARRGQDGYEQTFVAIP